MCRQDLRVQSSTVTSETDDPRFLAWYGTVQAALRSLAAIGEDVEAATGLPPGQVELLLNLAGHEGGRLRMGELAGDLLLSPGGVTRLVARMEEAGLVTREVPADDRRATYAVLTAAGREAAGRAAPAQAAAVERRFTGALSGREIDALRSAALKVLDGLHAPCDYLRR